MFIPRIGLEVHIQLNIKFKAFSHGSNIYGSQPNAFVSETSFGYPGALPFFNTEVINAAIQLCNAFNCEISQKVEFDRKHYFYPDLPKGYQITQHRTPIGKGGEVPIYADGKGIRSIALDKIQIEEDSGKSSHLINNGYSLIDFNRSGWPLLELVTTPEIKTGADAFLFLKEIQKVVKYLGISTGKMEQGSLRCDVNVSVARNGDVKMGNKSEVKNLNSTAQVQKAIDFEVKRQIKKLQDGGSVKAATMGYNEHANETFVLRFKEELAEYRFTPEPDIPKFSISEELLRKWNIKKTPFENYLQLHDDLKLRHSDALIISANKELFEYFKRLIDKGANPVIASKWLCGPLRSMYTDDEIDFIAPRKLADLINLVTQEKVSQSAALQIVLPEILKHPERDAYTVASELKCLMQNNEKEIGQKIDHILNSYPKQVRLFQQGKKGLLGFFMQKLMEQSKGQVNPSIGNRLLRERLKTNQ